jgi:hypothetical protein
MWKTWAEIRQIAVARKIVFYGRSEDWVPRSIPHVKADYIVDSNKNLHGTFYLGCEVKAPDAIQLEQKPFIVITTGDYINIAEFLTASGFHSGTDFCPCPEYYDFKSLDDLRNMSFEILLSSSDYTSGKATRTSYHGGGIFVLRKNEIEPQLEKKLDGQYRQLRIRNDHFVAVEYNQAEMHWIDFNYKIIDRLSLPRAHCCGMDIDVAGNIYVTNASTDEIYVYSKEKVLTEIIPFGIKSGDLGTSAYHINDLTVDDQFIYVSYFSHCGHWRKNIFDGGVVAICRATKREEKLYTDLWQPHSPQLHQGNLYIADSSNGKVLKDTISSVAEFPGFIRGLDFRNDYLVIGQSETMYTSRKAGISKNIMNNSGIYLFDERSKASRFFATYGICNIHDLKVLEMKNVF